jgi:hypothetical protein
MRITFTAQGPYRRLILVEVGSPFMEALRLQARAEGTTPGNLLADAIESVVPAESAERVTRGTKKLSDWVRPGP